MPGDWREWLDSAKTDLNSWLKASEPTPVSAMLAGWARAYGPELVDIAKRYGEAVQLLGKTVAAWDEVRRVAKGGESDVALVRLMEQTKMRMDEVREYLRGVGRD